MPHSYYYAFSYTIKESSLKKKKGGGAGGKGSRLAVKSTGDFTKYRPVVLNKIMSEQ